MKTYPIIAFVTAFVAFVFSPLSLEIASSLIFSVGLACVVLFDYSREPARGKPRLAPVETFQQPVREPKPEFELAA
ncbi:MAG TPA: hypothetical protein VL069_06835 [Opitutus sp.]|nr:hypothetical protein [Opitutus sp.]